MDLLKRIGLLILAGLFALLGFFFSLMLLQDKSDGVYGYVALDTVVILFGLAGIFFCSRALTKLRKEKIASDAIKPLPEVISAGLSVKAKLLEALLIVLTIASAYGLLNIFPDPKGSIILLICTGLCGLLTYLVWLQFDSDGETLRLDRSGINHKWYGNIPWSQIVGISLQSAVTRGVTTHALFIGLADRQKYLANMPWLMRKLLGLSMSPGSRMSLSIPLHLLNVDANIIENVALRQRELHQPPMQLGWHYSMTETEFIALLDVSAKFQDFDDELLYLDKQFNSGKVLTDLEITEANSKMEAILTARFKAVNEVLESNKVKSKKANQTVTIFITIGLFLLGVQLYSFYLNAGPSWIFGVFALMLVSVAANFGWKFYKIKKNMSQ